MSLVPGTKLGPYEIVALIGAGGMGEVYRALDNKLGREVAIKVLPEAFAENKERLARFEREARLLASLNHPNIATLFDLQEHDGTHFLVLELVLGETLAERLERGPIPAEEALPLFKQIAEALEAAHEKGIIHRDLKPANIKVTPEGKIKVLDFGLAKLVERDIVDTSAPTRTQEPHTEAGAVMGTPSYMSPEQAAGDPVDAQSDVFSLGCVMYEMLAGNRPFQGDSKLSIIKAILHDQLTPLGPDVPSELDRFISRCLEKEQASRYASAR